MKVPTLGRLAAASALASGLAGIGFSATPASASASTVSATGFIFGPINLPSSGQGVRVAGNCPSDIFDTTTASFYFLGGNQVFYQSGPGFSGGFNVEGTAELFFSSGEVFEGETHIWVNQNVNPTGNAQQYFGVTANFDGTGIDGTSGKLFITASLGGTTSASGSVSGWGHFNVTCS